MLGRVNVMETDAPRHDDEVSLRELYLILRRGLPLIIVVTVVSVVSAVLWNLWSATYVAEATIVSYPQGEQVAAFGFDARNTLDSVTAEHIAMNGATLEDALGRLEGTPGAPESVRELGNAAEVETLSGNGVDRPLTMTLRMNHGSAETAAVWANAWADATVDRLRAARIDAVEPVLEEVRRSVTSSATLVQAAERVYEDALALDLPGLQQRLVAANARVDWLISDVAALDRRLSALYAERDALPAGNVSERNALARDITRAEAEHAQVTDTLATELEGLDALRGSVAEADAVVRTARRGLEEAQASYRLVAEAQPLLELARNVTPNGTRILNAARPPSAPSGASTTLVAALAAVVAALTSTLFVFLREAVRDPASRIRS